MGSDRDARYNPWLLPTFWNRPLRSPVTDYEADQQPGMRASSQDEKTRRRRSSDFLPFLLQTPLALTRAHRGEVTQVSIRTQEAHSGGGQNSAEAYDLLHSDDFPTTANAHPPLCSAVSACPLTGILLRHDETALITDQPRLSETSPSPHLIIRIRSHRPLLIHNC